MTHPMPDETDDYAVGPYHSERDREKWLEWRNQIHYVGASELPVLCGITAPLWGSPLSIAAVKLGRMESLTQDNEMLESGRDMEPIAIRRLARDLDTTVKPYGWALNSKRIPGLGCTPDAIVPDQVWNEPGELVLFDAFAQVKNSAGYDDWSLDENGRLNPMRVWVQVQSEMAVTGHPWCFAGALIRGWEFKFARIARDDEFIDGTIKPTVARFIEYLKAGELPPPDFSDATRDAILALYPGDPDAPHITLPASFCDRDERFASLALRKKTIDKSMDQIRNEVRLLMKASPRADVYGSEAYWNHGHTKASHCKECGVETRKAGRMLVRQKGKK